MGKLTNLKPVLGTLAPRLGRAIGDKRGGERDRNDRTAGRAWYGTRQWAELRMAAFVRDGFTCQRTGVLLVGTYPEPNSPVANHKRPHRGDATLFFDLDNIETVSKAVHDSLIQAEEQAIPVGKWD